MKEHHDFCLNDKFNAWYKAQYAAFIALNPDIKEHPEKWDSFKFDLNQAKADAVCITDDILATCNCPSVARRISTNWWTSSHYSICNSELQKILLTAISGCIFRTPANIAHGLD